MAKVRKDCLFVAFIDMEKAYDRMNRMSRICRPFLTILADALKNMV